MCAVLTFAKLCCISDDLNISGASNNNRLFFALSPHWLKVGTGSALVSHIF